MRKWLIMVVAVLGFAAQAQAQDFSIRAGATLYFNNPVLFAIDAKLYATQVTKIAPSIDLGIIGGINLFLPSGGVGGIIGAGPALVFSFDRGAGFAYFGVNLGIIFAGNSNTNVLFALIGGVDYAINSSIGLFADFLVEVVKSGVDLGIGRWILSHRLRLHGDGEFPWSFPDGL